LGNRRGKATAGRSAGRRAGASGRYRLRGVRRQRLFQLRTTTCTLEEIAERVGYGSEAAFSAAFKREIGVALGAYRRSRVSVEAGT